MTSTGFNLKGKSRSDAMTIAADPRIFKPGTKVLMIFKDESYKSFNGVYTVRDVGGAIKGKVIDLFMGDFQSSKPHSSLYKFGRRKATVIPLSN